MVRNLKLGTRLGIGFGVMVVLICLTAPVAYSKFMVVKSLSHHLLDVIMTRVDAVSAARVAMRDGIHYFKNFVIRGGEYNKKFGTAMDEIAKQVDLYRATGDLTAEEDKQIRQILDATSVYRDAINKLTQLEGAHATPTEKDVYGGSHCWPYLSPDQGITRLSRSVERLLYNGLLTLDLLEPRRPLRVGCDGSCF